MSEKVFEADCVSVLNLFEKEGENMGFRIPIYQRDYDWDQSHLTRLVEDVLSGLVWCGDEEDDSLVFIGTILVVQESRSSKEDGFTGKSFSVIDGQQRLTTLALLCSVLIRKIREEYLSLKDEAIPVEIREWLTTEIDLTCGFLSQCCYGSVRLRGRENYVFPRVVRQQEDIRGTDASNSSFKSPISKYLHRFAEKYVANEDDLNVILEDTDANKKVNENVRIISELTSFHKGSKFSVDFPTKEMFGRSGFISLFDNVDLNEEEGRQIAEYIGKNDLVERIIGLTLFSNYLLYRVHVTIVETSKENYAFDIFDSLNTTGDPLTALQTIKPAIINFHESMGGYVGSDVESWMNDIDSYIRKENSSSKRESITKEIIVSFALYFSANRQSKKLDSQRRYMRSTYQRLSEFSSEENNRFTNEFEAKESFVKSINEIIDYRDRFWTRQNLRAQLVNCSDRESVLTCLNVLKDLDKTLVMPILSRYYWARDFNENSFGEIVKALTAFIVLRRGATGGTAGIDSDFRQVMTGVVIGEDELGLNILSYSRIPNVKEFKEMLKVLLKKKIGEVNRKEWVDLVVEQPLYEKARTLLRFMFFLAYHNAKPVQGTRLLEKTRNSPESVFLVLNRWQNAELETVEHIAPRNPGDESWDTSLYKSLNTIHTLGNCTILPIKENIELSNKSLIFKTAMYELFTLRSENEVEDFKGHLRDSGVDLDDRLFMEWEKSTQLPSLKPLCRLKEWSLETVRERGLNIAGLVYDEVYPWLFDS